MANGREAHMAEQANEKSAAPDTEDAEKASEHKSNLSTKNLVGYAMGDLGGCMTFAILGSFLTTYYTDVAGIGTGTVATMYVFLKVWDAVSDPLMGVIMDKVFARSKSAAKGKFRPWMLRATPLLCISAILMYTAPSLVEGAAKIVVACLTYLVYSTSYTMFNIPYGSLLSAMAHNDSERSLCSSARGFGAMAGNIVPLMLFPVIIDTFTEDEQLGYALGITLCAVVGLVFCLMSCFWTCERLEPSNSAGEGGKDGEDAADDVTARDILTVFRENRAFDAMCIMGLASCVAQYVTSTLGVYLYRDVYDALTMYSVMSAITMAVSCVCLLVVPGIAKRVGLERMVRVSQIISAVCYVLTFFCSPNVYSYMFFAALAAAASGVTSLQQWGMIGEAIDYNEYVTGKRTEGTIYGVYNMMRRLGQAIGSSTSVALLGVVGYDATLAAQAAATQTAIKGLITFVPAACMLVCWIGLKFVWNITPEVRAKMSATLASRHSAAE